jgi:hypothetical protein
MDWATEIGQAGTTLEAHIGVPVQFFIAPYDVCDPDALTYLQQNNYVGARCGDHGTNAPTFTDAFHLKYDVWGPSYSQYIEQGPTPPECQGVAPDSDTPIPSALPAACRDYVFKTYIETTIQQKGFAMREMHGFDDDGVNAWQPVSLADYQGQLDYLLTKVASGDLWVDGPTRVIKYRWAREACALPTVTGGNTLHFADPSADCKKNATILSYLVSTTDSSDPASLTVKQGGATLPTRKLSAGKFAVDADPTAGDAVLE